MIFLGIDYGIKRIGLALSDDRGTMAFPKEIIENNRDIFEKLSEIIGKENIEEIVIGESINFSGQANRVEEKIIAFTKELEARFKLPVHKQKEFLTSVEARKLKDDKKGTPSGGAHSRMKMVKSSKVDDISAVLILQRYLDKINK